MPSVIVMFPEFTGLQKLNTIRRKYDVNWKKVTTHITLVYPFNKHNGKLREALTGIAPFKIRLNKVRASTKDTYVFLDVTSGKDKIHELKKQLYKKLGLTWNEPFRFKPHISIAQLPTKKEQRQAVNDIKKEKLNFSCTIDAVYVLQVSEDLLTLQSKKKYPFKK